jgi:uncharacterized phiE125 gp8 family phage protein
MYYQLVTGPTTDPVTLDEAKVQLRVDHTDDDIYIRRLIKIARLQIEKLTNYVCVTSVWAAYDDEWPSGERIYLLKFPVTAISKVEYFASDDAEAYTELPVSSYDKATMYNPPVVKLKDTPSLGDKLNAVKVTFTAGHANTVDDPVPENIKQAMLILIGHLYENRQDEFVGNITSQLGKGFEYMLEQIRMLTP